MERRRRNLAVDRAPSSFLSWTGEHLDMHHYGFLSRVTRAASRSCFAVPPVEASLERATALQVKVEATPSTLVDGFSWVLNLSFLAVNENLLFKVVSTSARMILTSVLATEASGSGTRVVGPARPK